MLQVILSNEAYPLLADAELTGFGLLQGIAVIVRITLVYTELDDNGNAAGDERTTVFESTIESGDWNPKGRYSRGSVVFQNDEVVLFAPDYPEKLTGVLSIEAFDAITADSKVNVVSEACDIRCMDSSDCTLFQTPYNNRLDSEGPGVSFGTIVESTFNNGFVNPQSSRTRT